MTQFKGKNFWNSIALKYQSGRTKSRRFVVDPVIFEILGDVSGKKILDVGCGAGEITIQLAQKGAKCTGIDFSDKLINLAKEKSKELDLNIDYKVMDVKEVAGLNGKFDIGIIALLLPHLKTFPDICQTLIGISKRLNKKGRLVIAEPHPAFDFYMRNRLANGDYKYFSTGLSYDFEMKIGNHLLASEAYHWTVQDYSQALLNAGFFIKQIREPEPQEESKNVDQKWYEEKSKFPAYIIFDCIKY